MRGSNKYGIIFVVTLVIAIVYGANGVVTVNYAYERQVGGHIRNAFEVNTPEAMISELNKSVAGMHALGLVDGMYAAYFLWEQTPDRSMSFQYEYIDQLINRIIARCRDLNLHLTDTEKATKADFMVFLTVQTMNYLHSGRHRVAL